MTASAWRGAADRGLADREAAAETAAGLVLSAGFPMILLWGPDLVQLYNDGSACSASTRRASHPSSWSRS